MPTRYLRPGICDSEAINKLSAHAEVFFYRLLVNVDDFGRLDARPNVLRAKCFPIREEITSQDVEKYLQELSDCGLVLVYKCNEKNYLQMQKWENNARAKVSRCPAFDDTCIQLYTNVCNPRADADKSRTLLPGTGTGTENRNREPEPTYAPSDKSLAAGNANAKNAPIKPNGTAWENITDADLTLWKSAYPALNVEQELLAALAWVQANPKNTKSNYRRFLAGWLKRAQDRAPRVGGTSPGAAARGSNAWAAKEAVRLFKEGKSPFAKQQDGNTVEGESRRVG